jgi:predicted NAD/FAD-binding protein
VLATAECHVTLGNVKDAAECARGAAGRFEAVLGAGNPLVAKSKALALLAEGTAAENEKIIIHSVSYVSIFLAAHHVDHKRCLPY